MGDFKVEREKVDVERSRIHEAGQFLLIKSIEKYKVFQKCEAKITILQMIFQVIGNPLSLCLGIHIFAKLR